MINENCFSSIASNTSSCLCKGKAYSIKSQSSAIYMNYLKAMTIYQQSPLPNETYSGVNWNQMSDRIQPHEQRVHNDRLRTRCRPGACSPGGIGVDIKHGSYDRYMSRLKGSIWKRSLSSSSFSPR